jgi:hypothetical protein
MGVINCIILTLEKVGKNYRGNSPQYFYNIGPRSVSKKILEVWRVV